MFYVTLSWSMAYFRASWLLCSLSSSCTSSLRLMPLAIPHTPTELLQHCLGLLQVKIILPACIELKFGRRFQEKR